MKRHRAWVWVFQIALAAAIVWFAVARLQGLWHEFRNVEVQALKVHWLAAATLLVLATYASLIAAWQTILAGWNQHLSFARAARVWCVANLGRYLPGKIWAMAGLAMLAKREGIDAWAAAGSSVVMQGLAVGTGGAIGLALGTGFLNPWTVSLGAALGLLVVLIPIHPSFPQLVARITGDRFQARRLSLTSALSATAVAALSWVLYGMAVWLLYLGVGGGANLPLTVAVGAFATAYLAGLLAVIVPGGIGVREGVLVALLAPNLGAVEALVLAVAARLLFTIAEFIALVAAVSVTSKKELA